MASTRLAFLVAAAAGAMAASDSQGPAGFMWPPDRAWSENTDNNAPCGSTDGVTFRTPFPISNGKVALVAQDDSFQVQLSIAFKDDPQSNNDFSDVLLTRPINEVDPGHSCFSVTNPRPNIAPGANATIQIKYIADFDRPENQTFYACADITLVSAANFNPADVPCFNATSEENVPAPTTTGLPTNVPGHGENGPPLNTQPASSPALTPSPVSVPGERAVLSGGAVAGIVVGVLGALGLIGGLAFLFYRERQRKNSLIRQRDSARGVKWVEDPGKGSASSETIRMGNL